MLYFWLILLILLNAVWLVLVLFGLPGNWLIVTSTSLFAWWRWEDGVYSIYTLIVIVVLAGLGELLGITVKVTAGIIRTIRRKPDCARQANLAQYSGKSHLRQNPETAQRQRLNHLSETIKSRMVTGRELVAGVHKYISAQSSSVLLCLTEAIAVWYTTCR